MQVKKLEKLEFNNLNLNKLQELKDVLCSNKLYIDNEYLYKIFNLEIVDESQVDEIKRKISLFDSVNLDFLVTPEKCFYDGDTLKCVASKFIKNSETINDLAIRKGVSYALDNIIDASKKLRKLHYCGKNIVVGDMYFDNIIVDDKNKVFFIDVEGYGIEDFKPTFIPNVTSGFYDWMNYRQKRDINMDKVSFLLSLFGVVFEKNIMSIGEYAYDEKSEQLTFLKDLKEVFEDLKYTYHTVPDMPYLYELLPKKVK